MTELARTLPASWYRSPPLYQLERRAVFLKSWYLLGPVTRFQNVGEQVEYEVAQQPILASRVSGEARFPEADEIQVVCVKTERSLRCHVTPTGLVFATLSDEAPSFHEYFPELEPLLQKVDFTQRPYRRSIKYEGHFNWKTMVDGYQECLHCQYTHPSFSVYYPPTFYTVHNHQNFSQHIADPKKPDDGLFLYFFPNCTLNVYGGGMSSFRVCPTEDPNVTRMEFDYYHVESGDKFEDYFKFVRQVAMEDYELCERAQHNLEKGVYSEGILNPEKENGVSFYQDRVFELVCQQHASDRLREESSELNDAGIPLPIRQRYEASMSFDTRTARSGSQYNTAIPTSISPSSNMDILTSVVNVAPSVLVAFLAGFIFLYRAWPYLLIWDKRSLYTGSGSKPNDASATAAITEDQDEANVVSKEPEFLADWLTWICLAHRSRFAKPGDYQSFQVAGFPIFLVQGKDGHVRAFHNVCRHRAYTVIEKECGSSPVLLCRYHGWSYNTFGNLIKAPHFDHVPGFQKSQNSLFEIHTVMNDDGFLFVKFDASLTVSLPETDALDAFVQSNGLQTRTNWVAGQTIEGAFNWKLGISESRTVIRYDLYCNKATPKSHAISEVIVRLLTEKSRDLEAQYQSIISGSGKLEKSQNAEIYPAIRKPRENLKFEQAEQLCKELDCQSDLSRKDLSW
ncbi:hypothetical protein N8T08_003374 [Aspergillus melleus]|uniref:Uncharacterized protein n=1 Tax=Aspergillus melleus TaxID=138277 RepID=A0ACC3BH16_9EURO|nr:hypothetical protein N8T08_003374 [Aspergillus melleus]